MTPGCPIRDAPVYQQAIVTICINWSALSIAMLLHLEAAVRMPSGIVFRLVFHFRLLLVLLPSGLCGCMMLSCHTGIVVCSRHACR